MEWESVITGVVSAIITGGGIAAWSKYRSDRVSDQGTEQKQKLDAAEWWATKYAAIDLRVDVLKAEHTKCLIDLAIKSERLDDALKEMRILQDQLANALEQIEALKGSNRSGGGI